MNSKEIIDYLKSEASEKYKENVIKNGDTRKILHWCINIYTEEICKKAGQI